MFGKNPRATDSHIRRARVDAFRAELDLTTRVITISWQRPGNPSMLLGEGTWSPLPAPLGDLRGKILTSDIDRRICLMFEYRLGRGNRSWSYEYGPWVEAEQAAITAGIGEHEAETLRKLVWLFYRNRWPVHFSDGCGWGADGYAPLIAAALADPLRTRARWELLILTGALQWPKASGDLNEVAGDTLIDDFYASP